MAPWTVVRQAPLSMGFSRQEYWSRLPFPLPGDLPDPGIEPESPALQTVYLLSVPLFGKPNWKPNFLYFILIIQKSRKTEERMSFSDHLHCEQLAIRGLLSFMKHRECPLYPVYKTMYRSSPALATSSPLTLKVFSAHLQNIVKKLCQNWHGSSHLQSGGLFCECMLSRFS